MPYMLPRTLSLEGIGEYIVRTAAALAADSGTEDLVPEWDGQLRENRRLRGERDDARMKIARAEAVQRVIDARWDASIGDLSGVAWLAAGKSPTAEPYRSLFGTVTAARAKTFGAHKASVLGTNVVSRLEAMRHPELSRFIQPFGRVTQQLESAGKTSDQARRDLRQLGYDRDRHRTEVETLIARTEVALLGRLVGQRDAKQIVAAILSPVATSPRRTGVLPEAEENEGPRLGSPRLAAAETDPDGAADESLAG